MNESIEFKKKESRLKMSENGKIEKCAEPIYRLKRGPLSTLGTGMEAHMFCSLLIAFHLVMCSLLRCACSSFCDVHSSISTTSFVCASSWNPPAGSCRLYLMQPFSLLVAVAHSFIAATNVSYFSATTLNTTMTCTRLSAAFLAGAAIVFNNECG